MIKKKEKSFDKKILLIAAIVLVVLAIQIDALTRKEVKERFRCALRRIRERRSTASSESTTPTAAGQTTTAAGPTTTAAGPTKTAAGPTTTAAGPTTTAAGPTTTVDPNAPSIRVSQACNNGNIGTNSDAEKYSIIRSNNIKIIRIMIFF